MSRPLTPERLAGDGGGVVVECFRNIGPIENNLFLVWDPTSREGYLLDGGYEPQAVAAAIEERGLTLKGILVTHGHRDHHEQVGTLRALLGGVPVGIGEADREMLSVPAEFTIRDGDRFAFGPSALRAIHTPGHTPGSTCFLLDEARLFTGDTLFPGGPGNTQKDPQRFATIIDSIRSRLFTRPPETPVHPGHGRDTTIGAEQPSLDEWIARGW